MAKSSDEFKNEVRKSKVEVTRDENVKIVLNIFIYLLTVICVVGKRLKMAALQHLAVAYQLTLSHNRLLRAMSYCLCVRRRYQFCYSILPYSHRQCVLYY